MRLRGINAGCAIGGIHGSNRPGQDANGSSGRDACGSQAGLDQILRERAGGQKLHSRPGHNDSSGMPIRQRSSDSPRIKRMTSGRDQPSERRIPSSRVRSSTDINIALSTPTVERKTAMSDVAQAMAASSLPSVSDAAKSCAVMALNPKGFPSASASDSMASHNCPRRDRIGRRPGRLDLKLGDLPRAVHEFLHIAQHGRGRVGFEGVAGLEHAGHVKLHAFDIDAVAGFQISATSPDFRPGSPHGDLAAKRAPAH